MNAIKTSAAAGFLDAVTTAWDSREPWLATAAKGLSDVDADALRQMCDESGEDYDTAESEVLAAIRETVA